MQLIAFPAQWVCSDVRTNTCEVGFVADDVFVIITLPQFAIER